MQYPFQVIVILQIVLIKTPIIIYRVKSYQKLEYYAMHRNEIAISMEHKVVAIYVVEMSLLEVLTDLVDYFYISYRQIGKVLLDK